MTIKNQYVGILNNTKWNEVFGFIEDNSIPFSLKILSDNKKHHCNLIFECEENAILVDHSGSFIRYQEIEYIELPISFPTKDFLIKIGIDFIIDTEAVTIYGYKKIAD